LPEMQLFRMHIQNNRRVLLLSGEIDVIRALLHERFN
jgi:hypothetical protein